MKAVLILAALMAFAGSGADDLPIGQESRLVLKDPPPPLASGTYDFEHRYAEHPDMPSLRLRVHIDGDHVIVENRQAADPFPAGVIDEGRLMWHPVEKRWIIGHDDSDRLRRDVGGCSDGPHVIDLEKRVFWTC